MKKIIVLHTTIFILFCGIASSFGQTVSEEAKRYNDRGIAAVEMAKSLADYAAAIKEFEQAVKIAPDWPIAYYNLGRVQEKVEKYSDAITNLKQYIRLAPKASDTETVKTLINKLEYKMENVLSVSEVTDILVSYSNDAKLPFVNRKWKESFRPPATGWLGGGGWGWGDIKRDGDNSIRVVKSLVFPYIVDRGVMVMKGDPPVMYYQTVKVEGRILRFRFTYVEFDQPTELEIELEVVSRTLIRVKETVTRPGLWNKEWYQGQTVSGELRR